MMTAPEFGGMFSHVVGVKNHNLKMQIKIFLVAIVAWFVSLKSPVARDGLFDSSVSLFLPFSVEMPQIYKSGIVNSKSFGMDSTYSKELVGMRFNLSSPSWNAFDSLLSIIGEDSNMFRKIRSDVLESSCVGLDTSCQCRRSLGSKYEKFCNSPRDQKLHAQYLLDYQGFSVGRELTCFFTKEFPDKIFDIMDFLLYTAIGYDQPEFSPFVVNFDSFGLFCEFSQHVIEDKSVYEKLGNESDHLLLISLSRWYQFKSHFKWGFIPIREFNYLIWDAMHWHEGGLLQNLVYNVRQRTPEYYRNMMRWIEENFSEENMRIVMSKLVTKLGTMSQDLLEAYDQFYEAQRPTIGIIKEEIFDRGYTLRNDLQNVWVKLNNWFTFFVYPYLHTQFEQAVETVNFWIPVFMKNLLSMIEYFKDFSKHAFDNITTLLERMNEKSNSVSVSEIVPEHHSDLAMNDIDKSSSNALMSHQLIESCGTVISTSSFDNVDFFTPSDFVSLQCPVVRVEINTAFVDVVVPTPVTVSVTSVEREVVTVTTAVTSLSTSFVSETFVVTSTDRISITVMTPSVVTHEKTIFSTSTVYASDVKSDSTFPALDFLRLADNTVSTATFVMSHIRVFIWFIIVSVFRLSIAFVLAFALFWLYSNNTIMRCGVRCPGSFDDVFDGDELASDTQPTSNFSVEIRRDVNNETVVSTAELVPDIPGVISPDSPMSRSLNEEAFQTLNLVRQHVQSLRIDTSVHSYDNRDHSEEKDGSSKVFEKASALIAQLPSSIWKPRRRSETSAKTPAMERPAKLRHAKSVTTVRRESIGSALVASDVELSFRFRKALQEWPDNVRLIPTRVSGVQSPSDCAMTVFDHDEYPCYVPVLNWQWRKSSGVVFPRTMPICDLIGHVEDMHDVEFACLYWMFDIYYDESARVVLHVYSNVPKVAAKQESGVPRIDRHKMLEILGLLKDGQINLLVGAEAPTKAEMDEVLKESGAAISTSRWIDDVSEHLQGDESEQGTSKNKGKERIESYASSTTDSIYGALTDSTERIGNVLYSASKTVKRSRRLSQDFSKLRDDVSISVGSENSGSVGSTRTVLSHNSDESDDSYQSSERRKHSSRRSKSRKQRTRRDRGVDTFSGIPAPRDLHKLKCHGVEAYKFKVDDGTLIIPDGFTLYPLKLEKALSAKDTTKIRYTNGMVSDGYCYLRLLHVNDRRAAQDTLGFCPLLSVFFSYVDDNKLKLKPKTFISQGNFIHVNENAESSVSCERVLRRMAAKNAHFIGARIEMDVDHVDLDVLKVLRADVFLSLFIRLLSVCLTLVLVLLSSGFISIISSALGGLVLGLKFSTMTVNRNDFNFDLVGYEAIMVICLYSIVFSILVFGVWRVVNWCAWSIGVPVFGFISDLFEMSPFSSKIENNAVSSHPSRWPLFDLKNFRGMDIGQQLTVMRRAMTVMGSLEELFAETSSSIVRQEIPFNTFTRESLQKRIRFLLSFLHVRNVIEFVEPVTGRYIEPKTLVPDMLTNAQIATIEKHIGYSIIGTKSAVQTQHKSNFLVYVAAINSIYKNIPVGSVVIDVGSNIAFTPVQGYIANFCKITAKDGMRSEAATRTLRNRAIMGSSPTIDSADFLSLTTRCTTVIFNFVHDVPFSAMMLKCRELGASSVYVTMAVTGGMLVFGNAQLNVGQQRYSVKGEMISSHFDETNEPYIHDKGNYFSPVLFGAVRLPDGTSYYRSVFRQFGSVIIFNYSLSSADLGANSELKIDSKDDGQFRYVAVDISLSLKLELRGRLIRISEDLVTSIHQTDSHTKDGTSFDERVDRVARHVAMGFIYGGNKMSDAIDAETPIIEDMMQVVRVLLGQKLNLPFMIHVSRFEGSLSRKLLHLLIGKLPLVSNSNIYKLFVVKPRSILMLSETLDLSNVKLVHVDENARRSLINEWYKSRVIMSSIDHSYFGLRKHLLPKLIISARFFMYLSIIWMCSLFLPSVMSVVIVPILLLRFIGYQFKDVGAWPLFVVRKMITITGSDKLFRSDYSEIAANRSLLFRLCLIPFLAIRFILLIFWRFVVRLRGESGSRARTDVKTRGNTIGELNNVRPRIGDVLSRSDIEYCDQQSVASQSHRVDLAAARRTSFAPVTEINVADHPQISGNAFIMRASSISTSSLILEKTMLYAKSVEKFGLRLLGLTPTNLMDSVFINSDAINKLLVDKPFHIDTVLNALESQSEIIVICGDLYYTNTDISRLTTKAVVCVEDRNQLYRRVDLSDDLTMLRKFLERKRQVACDSLLRFLCLIAGGLTDFGEGQCWRKCLGHKPYGVNKRATKDMLYSDYRDWLVHDLIKYKAVLLTDREAYNLLPTGNQFVLYADKNDHCYRLNADIFERMYNLSSLELKPATDIMFALDGSLFRNEVSNYHLHIKSRYDAVISKISGRKIFNRCLREYLQYLREMELQTISSFCVYNCDFGLEEAKADKKLHIFDNFRGVFMESTERKSFSVGWDGNKYVEFDRSRGRFDTRSDYVICHENVLYLREREILNLVMYNRYDLDAFDFSKVKFVSIAGVPGCGKTSEIKTRVEDLKKKGRSFLVLTATHANAVEYSSEQRLKFRRFRTYDSYFMLNAELKADYLFCDESFMVHFAEILLSVIKCGCRKVFMMGDPSQIPFVSRVISFDLKYQQYISKNIEFRNTTYRVPEAHLPILRPFYPNIISLNTNDVNYPIVETLKSSEPVVRGFNVIICFTQFEKLTLMECNPGELIHTIHEVQGNTYSNVCIVRIVKHENQIYDSIPHIIVAVSRHRRNLTYMTVNDKDKLSQLFRTPDKFVKDNKEFVDISVVPSCEYVHWELEENFIDDSKLDISKYEKSIMDVVNSKVCDGILIESRNYAPFVLDNSIGYDVNVEDVQLFLDAFYEHNDPDKRLHLLEQALLQIPSSVQINMPKFVEASVKPMRPLKMSPRLFTPQPPLSRGELGTLLEALKTRNINPPLLYLARASELIDEVVDLFFDTFIDAEIFKARKVLRNFDNGVWLKEWLKGRTSDQISLINQVDPSFVRGNVYDSIIKPTAKAKYDNSHNYKLAAPQVVTAHNPYITFLFSGIAKCFSHELKISMKDKWILNDGLNAENLSGRFNNVMLGLTNVRFLEVDFSKYDKSQELFCLKIFLEILSRFGVPQHYLDDWERYHISNIIKFKREGVKTRVDYQRRSGDVFTFVGNTIVAMCCIAWSYKDVVRKAAGGVFGGDDSLVVFPATVSIKDNTQVISDIFNLVAKIEHFPDCPVFSSRFLLNLSGRWMFVPDPLKAIVKLGRDDLYNYEHVEYYYISFCDNFKCFRDERVVNDVSKMLTLRYADIFREMDCSVLCKFLCNLLQDKKMFFNLFVPTEHVSNDMPVNKLRSIMKSLRLI